MSLVCFLGTPFCAVCDKVSGNLLTLICIHAFPVWEWRFVNFLCTPCSIITNLDTASLVGLYSLCTYLIDALQLSLRWWAGPPSKSVSVTDIWEKLTIICHKDHCTYPCALPCVDLHVYKPLMASCLTHRTETPNTAKQPNNCNLYHVTNFSWSPWGWPRKKEETQSIPNSTRTSDIPVAAHSRVGNC